MARDFIEVNIHGDISQDSVVAMEPHIVSKLPLGRVISMWPSLTITQSVGSTVGVTNASKQPHTLR